MLLAASLVLDAVSSSEQEPCEEGDVTAVASWRGPRFPSGIASGIASIVSSCSNSEVVFLKVGNGLDTGSSLGGTWTGSGSGFSGEE